jgi:hypothetical protein
LSGFLFPGIEKLGAKHLSRAIKGFNENRPRMFSQNASFWGLVMTPILEFLYGNTADDGNLSSHYFDFPNDIDNKFISDYVGYFYVELSNRIKLKMKT